MYQNQGFQSPGFQPQQTYNSYVPNLYPMMQRQQPQPSPQPNQNIGWVQVNGYEGAKAQTVQPGNVCWMRDTSEPFIYAKSVDAIGTPTVEMFRVEKIDPSAMHAQGTSENNTVIEMLSKRVEALEKEIREAKERGMITARRRAEVPSE